MSRNHNPERLALWGAGAMVLFVLLVLAVAAELVRYWLP